MNVQHICILAIQCITCSFSPSHLSSPSYPLYSIFKFLSANKLLTVYWGTLYCRLLVHHLVYLRLWFLSTIQCANIAITIFQLSHADRYLYQLLVPLAWRPRQPTYHRTGQAKSTPTMHLIQTNLQPESITLTRRGGEGHRSQAPPFSCGSIPNRIGSNPTIGSPIILTSTKGDHTRSKRFQCSRALDYLRPTYSCRIRDDYAWDLYIPALS